MKTILTVLAAALALGLGACSSSHHAVKTKASGDACCATGKAKSKDACCAPGTAKSKSQCCEKH